MTTVFVYGTLKRGFGLAHHLTGQTFLGVAQTSPIYRLASLENGDYPGLYSKPDDGISISGELWSVDSACLRELDRVEGVAEGLYTRATVQLLPPHSLLAAEAYLYLGDISDKPDAGSAW